MIRNAKPCDIVEYQGFTWWIDRIIDPAFPKGKKVYVIKRPYKPILGRPKKVGPSSLRVYEQAFDLCNIRMGKALKVHTSSTTAAKLKRAKELKVA